MSYEYETWIWILYENERRTSDCHHFSTNENGSEKKSDDDEMEMKIAIDGVDDDDVGYENEIWNENTFLFEMKKKKKKKKSDVDETYFCFYLYACLYQKKTNDDHHEWMMMKRRMMMDHQSHSH